MKPFNGCRRTVKTKGRKGTLLKVRAKQHAVTRGRAALLQGRGLGPRRGASATRGRARGCCAGRRGTPRHPGPCRCNNSCFSGYSVLDTRLYNSMTTVHSRIKLSPASRACWSKGWTMSSHYTHPPNTYCLPVSMHQNRDVGSRRF